MNYCQNKNAFGSKESPSYENTDIWAIFTAARCGYIPYGDTNYFDKWFANTKEYLQLLKNHQAAGLEVLSIRDVTPVPHNGCRPPKRRRV